MAETYLQSNVRFLPSSREAVMQFVTELYDINDNLTGTGEPRKTKK